MSAPPAFDPAIVAAVLGHMNGDHPEDSLLIVRAFGAASAVTAEMVALDGLGGTWRWADAAGAGGELAVPWPGGAITERPEIRREVVKLYDAACAALGVEPRPHD